MTFGVMENKDDLWITDLLKNGVSISGVTEEEYRAKGMLIMPYKECLELIDKTEEKKYIGDWKRIGKDEYEYAFEALPPVKYTQIENIELFASSEPYSGDIHYHYAHIGDLYLRAARRLQTPIDVLQKQIKEVL